MEITLELVERLQEKAPESYAQAKQALEYSEGNLLDAMIYLEENGAMATGWRFIDGAYYYMKENGAMQNVTLYEDETVYTFRENGSLAAAKKKRKIK